MWYRSFANFRSSRQTMAAKFRVEGRRRSKTRAASTFGNELCRAAFAFGDLRLTATIIKYVSHPLPTWTRFSFPLKHSMMTSSAFMRGSLMFEFTSSKGFLRAPSLSRSIGTRSYTTVDVPALSLTNQNSTWMRARWQATRISRLSAFSFLLIFDPSKAML